MLKVFEISNNMIAQHGVDRLLTGVNAFDDIAMTVL